LIFITASSVQAASPCTAQAAAYEARLKRTLESVCDNDDQDCLTGSTEAANIMKEESEWIWEKNEAEEAYTFGLSIQKLVREGDLEGLFALVDGELKNGPRRKSALSLSFHDLFNEQWVKTVLDNEPPCGASWRGYMLGPGYIWYHERDGKWQIFSINGATEETAKPMPARWQVDKNILSQSCFAYEWIASDNFKEFAKQFKIRNFSDFRVNTGKYIGQEINSYEPITPSWCLDNYCNYGGNSPDKISLIRFVKECSSTPRPLKIQEHSIQSKVGSTEYALLGSVPSEDCQNLAPSVNAACLESYLVEVSEGGGGSMGPTWSYGIYGVFVLEGFGKAVIPLKFFQNKNYALNFLDSIK
jgi:hypothetical protein